MNKNKLYFLSKHAGSITLNVTSEAITAHLKMDLRTLRLCRIYLVKHMVVGGHVRWYFSITLGSLGQVVRNAKMSNICISDVLSNLLVLLPPFVTPGLMEMPMASPEKSTVVSEATVNPVFFVDVSGAPEVAWRTELPFTMEM